MEIKKFFYCLFAYILISCSGFTNFTAKAGGKGFLQWAETPPMGWNSWDCYGPTVTEKEVRANADYMAANLKKYGWEYIIVDIRWYVDNDKAHGYNQKNPVYNMDQYGRFMPSIKRFPSAADGKGFRTLSDYMHSKGLKFGIHVMRGVPAEGIRRNLPVLGSRKMLRDICTPEGQCQWLRDMYSVLPGSEGSQEYYNSIFKLYAFWGVDYVKVDDLSSPYHLQEIDMIRKAIDNCGRKIVLSTSPGPAPIAMAEHLKEHANLWRICDDFWDDWQPLKKNFDYCNEWSAHIGSGHWPDADMLPLGRIGIRAERGDDRMSKFTRDEQYTLMTLCSIFRSPLMFGGDLPSNDGFTLSLLTNDEVLYVNQHSINNKQLYRNGDIIVWTANDPKSKDTYVAVFNASEQDNVKIAVSFDQLGLKKSCSVRDLWAKKDMGSFTNEFDPTIPKHGAGLYKIHGKKKK